MVYMSKFLKTISILNFLVFLCISHLNAAENNTYKDTQLILAEFRTSVDTTKNDADKEKPSRQTNNLKDTQEEQKQDKDDDKKEDKKVDYRIFAGLGFGLGMQTAGDSHHLVLTPNLFGGGEFMFSNGSGVNVLVLANAGSATIGGNYVYETKGNVNYAFLTGLAMGTTIITPDKQNSFIMAYDVGVRFRKNHHALSLHLNIPIFPYSIHPYASYQKNYDILGNINYTYFFKL